MIFSEPRTSRAGLTHEAGEFLRLKERVKSIKASLKDIEYEKGVGKMDAENADRLTEELLAEWDILEPKIAEYEKIPHTTTPQCPQCGTTILSQAAKFCHACGSKLALLLLAVSLFLFTPRAILAYDIHVTVQNGTTEGVETTPLTIQLLRLSQGMEPVTTKKSAAGKASFTNLPEIGNAPYMLQTVYKGVAYNRVIAPNIPSPADVKLEVFDSTAS
ncbi:MAG TPA: zinc ribbon domain-containing protein, partial [Turneriella sp.]|nr:zinc ribbon domain-containing protein [Turneriella sp.]